MNKTTGRENFSMSHLQVNLGSSMLIRMGPPSVKQKGDIKKKMLKKSALRSVKNRMVTITIAQKKTLKTSQTLKSLLSLQGNIRVNKKHIKDAFSTMT